MGGETGKKLFGYASGDVFQDKRGEEYSRTEDRATGKDKEREAKEAADRAAGLAKTAKSKSQALKRGADFAETGEAERKSLLKKTGRKATKVVGRETLGGRSLL